MKQWQNETPKVTVVLHSGKRSLVKCASSGIGLASAAALAEVGTDVTLVARSISMLEVVARAFETKGRRSTPLQRRLP